MSVFFTVNQGMVMQGNVFKRIVLTGIKLA